MKTLDKPGRCLADMSLHLEQGILFICLAAAYLIFILSDVKTCMPEYHCLLSTVVIESTSLCDAMVDCPNADDERFCSFR